MSMYFFSTFSVRLSMFASAALMVAACGSGQANAPASAVPLPAPKIDAARIAAADAKPAVAVFAGGCFWGVEAVFETLQGVGQVSSGYAGATPKRLPVSYEDVSKGRTGFAESVRVEYDPAQISYGQLLQVFFSVAHDPTQRNRQGPDIGAQYRSAIYYRNNEQQRIARAYIDQLNAAKVYPNKIVTQLEPLTRFYQAEDYHQDYMRRNPNQPYIVQHDRPKLENLKRQFPQWIKRG